MKQLLTAAFLFAIMLSGCQKSADVSQPAVQPPVAPPVAKPSASFTITNLNEIGQIRELRTLTIQNTSTNADSYSWDFGTSANYSDGIVDYPMQFSDKAEPANMYMVPCMQTVTIKLTAKNKVGDVSTTSQSFYVYCFRGAGGRHPIMHQLY